MVQLGGRAGIYHRFAPASADLSGAIAPDTPNRKLFWGRASGSLMKHEWRRSGLAAGCLLSFAYTIRGHALQNQYSSKSSRFIIRPL